MEHTQEYEVDAVTTLAGGEALTIRVQQLHPYELPAVLITMVQAGEAYACWVTEQVI